MIAESDYAPQKRQDVALACLPAFVLTFRLDKSLDYCSAQWSQFTGLSEQEQRGGGWLAAVHPDDRLNTTCAWHDAMKRGEPRVLECRLRKRGGGGYGNFLVRAAPNRDEAGSIVGLCAVYVELGQAHPGQVDGHHHNEIEERKRTEQALRESENKYRFLYENQLDGFAHCRMVYDGEGRPCDFVYLDVNAAFVRSTGLRDVVGKRATEVFPGIRRAKPDLMEIYGRVASTGKPERIEVFFEPRSWFHVSVYSPKKDHFVSVVENVTRRKAAEAERERLLEALREADRRKNEFLAMLSHELRNPLAPIRSSLYILDRSVPGGEQAHRARAVIERQVTHLTRLVNDLLDVSRITRGRIELQRERLDLCELVSRTLEDHRPIFAARGIEVHAEQPQVPVWMNGDATRLEQALANILQNAAKFTPEGGRVFVQVRKEVEEAAVVVRDTGAGIAPDVLSDLFQPFMQADRSLDRSAGGMGLGLSLVKGLIDLHGGSVQASSGGAGQGAEFTIRLPLEIEPARAEQPETDAASSRFRRVLVIEDNMDSAVSLKDALELNRHEVTLAFTGIEGLTRARAFAPDVVLCDIGLPGMDGYDVARAFRADDALHNTALVALTGYASAEDRKKAQEAGFDWHLAKPPGLEEIERILEQVTRSRTASLGRTSAA